MRSRYSLNRLRDDMFRSGERALLARLRLGHEVHRKVPDPPHGGSPAPWPYRVAAHLDAQP